MIHSFDTTDVLSMVRIFGEVLDASGTGLLVQSGTANLMVNATALDILGVNEATLLKMPPGADDWQARHTDGRPLTYEELPCVQALRSQRPVNDQVFSFAEQVGGQRRWVSVSAVPCPVTQAGESILYCFIKDISESIQRSEFSDRCREEAQDASHIKDDFLALLVTYCVRLSTASWACCSWPCILAAGTASGNI